MNKMKSIIGILLFLYSNFIFAEQCPTPQIIKDRKISRDFEWTLDERMTLEHVLAVEKLYSVRIKNDGEFIACYYSGHKGLLRLDGKPEGDSCRLQKETGNWDLVNNNEQICKEADLSLCLFSIICAESAEPAE